MKEIDWSKLSFHYTETDYIVRSACKDGVWEEPYATKDKTIQLHVASTGKHSGEWTEKCVFFGCGRTRDAWRKAQKG